MFNITHYKKGDVIDALISAGEDFDMVTDGNIRIDCFPKRDFIQIPLLESNKPGSGKLDNLLKKIEQFYKKPLLFVNLINPLLESHLRSLGYSCKEITE